MIAQSDVGFATDGDRTSKRTSLTVLAVFAILVISYHWLPLVTQDLDYQAVGLMTAGSMLLGVQRWRPSSARGWRFLTIGVRLFSVADLFCNFYDIFLHRAIFYPSIADVLYLVAYVFLAWGLVRLARAGYSGPGWGLVVEGGIFGLAAAAVGWTVLIDPVLGQSHDSVMARGVDLAYPFADVVLIAIPEPPSPPRRGRGT